MKKEQLRKSCLNVEVFPQEVLDWIENQKYWNLWVPKSLGGLDKSFIEGLQTLQKLAQIDGSLGWTVTLCAGANYFAGNMKNKMAENIFFSSKNPILGGSGGVFGTAEKIGDNFLIYGTWKYATGAPYLSHFTLNAKITEDGIPVKDEEGNDRILSFVLPEEKVKIINDWKMMGLQATATNSFLVKDVLVSSENTFVYNKFYYPQNIFKIPFKTFADLTLWVNYLGMGKHYFQESSIFLPEGKLKNLKSVLETSEKVLYEAAEQVIDFIKENKEIEISFMDSLHRTAAKLIVQLSQKILEVHPLLGMKAAQPEQQLNSIFRDYFTATQHKNFSEHF